MGADRQAAPVARRSRRVGRWARNLTGDLAGSDDFAVLLGAQVQAARDGVVAVLASTGGTPSGGSGQTLSDIELRGDRARAAVVAELTRKLVTPIDREDLFRLSRSVDDVLDNVHDLGRELSLYRTSASGPVAELLDLVLDGLDTLQCAVESAMAGTPGAPSRVLDVKRAASRVRQGYQGALALLFAGELTMEVVKQREVLRRLDVIGLRLGEAADSLADGLIKRHR